MEVLLNIALALGGAATVGGAIGTTRFVFSRYIGNKFDKQLKNTAFSSLVKRNPKALDSQPVASKLPLEARPGIKEGTHAIPVSEYVNISQIPGGLRAQALRIAEDLTESQSFAGLTVEQEHELGAIKDSLLIILKAYDNFTPQQRQNTQIQEKVENQLNALNTAIENCRHDYEEDQLRALNANGLFIESKFTSEPSSAKVITSTVTA